MRVSVREFAIKFLQTWNEATGHEYSNVRIMEKALRKVLGKSYTQAQLLKAAQLAGSHPYWGNTSPYRLFHEENSRGYQDGIGDLLSIKSNLLPNDRTNL